jgi:hypothetical protein
MPLSNANRGLVQLLKGKSAESERDFARCFKLNGEQRPTLEM